MTSARKTLPRLDFGYPPGTEARLRAGAEQQARRWREQEPDHGRPAGDRQLPVVRACCDLSRRVGLRDELAAEAKAGLGRGIAAPADAAAVHGIDPEALDGAIASELMQDAGRHADALRKSAREPGTSSATAAATRAQTQPDRWETYLVAAGLARWDDEDYCLVCAAADDVPEAS